jgi:hypothetical protein
MKTTIEIPDPLFRKAKATAAERGQSLKDFMTEALIDKLDPRRSKSAPTEPAWMTGFGALRRLHKETAHIQSLIDETFETIEAEDRL